MKKILIYICSFLLIIFLLPSMCTKRRQEVIASTEGTQITEQNKTNEQENDEEKNKKYEYSNFATIKLYHVKTGEIQTLSLDEYLYNVVSSEMPVDFDLEALKAQAIVARTYTIYQIINSKGKHGEADICDDSTCCQAWMTKEERMAKWESDVAESNWSKILNAVDSTAGEIITYNGSPIDAFFHSNSGGITETASNVWGGSNFPYLQSVETAGEDGYLQYSSEVVFTKEELLGKLKEKYTDIEINFEQEDSIQITEYTEANRVKTIKFGNTQITGTQARTILGLKSTNFSFEINEEKIIFYVIGYGHGVGMSQTGADSMAKAR